MPERNRSHFDLLIRGATVVDGTGLPRRRGDVGVASGRISRVGRLDSATADETLDADGLIVAPGIVDPHTHYDPQITFDPDATSSCYHGVTTVLAGNCGFGVAPVRPDDREFITRLFAKIEGMDPVALSGICWEFETFTEFLTSRHGKLGLNLACYVGHSNLRRWVMGPDGSRRAATPSEVSEMRRLLREALGAGAAGLSSSHSPTHNDGDDRPVPSRLADREELLALVAEVGAADVGTITYLPASSVGGLNEQDMDLLVQMGRISRRPIIIQGLGGRSKVDAPTATWEAAKAFLERATDEGAPVYSLLLARPFDRPFTLAEGTNLYEGVPAWNRLMSLTRDQRRAALSDPAWRDELRWAVEQPNRDPARGSTLPPPQWTLLFVGSVIQPDHEPYLRRPIAELAEEGGVAPADFLLDLALSEDLATEFRWSTETPEWVQAVAEAQLDPHMLIGTSDGGAHLSRDDGAEYSSYFLREWVLERRVWTLEEGIRRITQVPAALLGFAQRGMVIPGYFADLMVFDPATIGPWKKEKVHDLPGGVTRFQATPKGVFATIVNGTPVVLNGKLTGRRPGTVVAPN
jgi:N-acyl-D-amino-acid deacylase